VTDLITQAELDLRLNKLQIELQKFILKTIVYVAAIFTLIVGLLDFAIRK